MRAEDGFGFPFGDLLVHTWDLARAIGADDRLLPEACTLVLAQLEPIDALIRGPGTFGPKLEPALLEAQDASKGASERRWLVAMNGRASSIHAARYRNAHVGLSAVQRTRATALAAKFPPLWIAASRPNADPRSSAAESFATAIRAHGDPVEVVTGRAAPLGVAIDELLPGAFYNMEQYANNRIENDHGRLNAWLRPMCGLKRDGMASTIIRGHSLIQSIRRGHYELGVEACSQRRGRVHRTGADDLTRGERR